MRKELDAKLLAQLSDEQKAKFEEMKGEPFELAPMTFGGRGGLGGQRGGPEGRGREGDRPQRDRQRGGDRPERD
jgi:hypothetical protein